MFKLQCETIVPFTLEWSMDSSMNLTLFWIFSILFVLIRARFHQKEHDTQMEFAPTREHWMAGQFSLTLLGTHGWWLSNATPTDSLSLSMWCGGILMGTSLPLLYWVHHSLGQYFSARLVLQEDHQIIQKGPYQWIRHPMYTVGFLYLIGAGLLSNSTIVLLLPTLSFGILVGLRVSDEEAMLEQSNPKYTEYKQSTGRFLPKF